MSATLACQRCGRVFECRRSDALWCPECREARHKERQRGYEGRRRTPCPDCGKPMVRGAAHCKTCANQSHIRRNRGEDHPSWKGGRTVANGYVFLRTSGIPGGPGHAYQAEHRLVWEQAHGPLPQNWVVHHLNGVKDDNRLQNLTALPRKEHSPRRIVAPYEERIRLLEEQLRQLR